MEYNLIDDFHHNYLYHHAVLQSSDPSPPSFSQMSPAFPATKARSNSIAGQRQALLSLNFLVIGAGAIHLPRFPPSPLALNSPTLIQASVVWLARILLLPPAIV